MTPTGRASVGRSYSFQPAPEKRARDDRNSEFNCYCPLGRLLLLGGLVGRLPFRWTARHRISAGLLRRADRHRRMDRKGSTAVNLHLIIAVAIGGAIGSVARYLVGIG
jgi:hypothetical protein